MYNTGADIAEGAHTISGTTADYSHLVNPKRKWYNNRR
jgi:hypothetical protein